MDADRIKMVQSAISTIYEFMVEGQPGSGSTEIYRQIADKMSKIAGKEPAWTWRYVQGVHKGHMDPSPIFATAVNAMGAALDEVPVLLGYTVQVQVYARPNAIRPGSIILGESKPCAWPGCRIMFVPRVPWQRYCSMELHIQAQRELRRNA